MDHHLRRIGVDTVVVAGCNYPSCPRGTLFGASERVWVPKTGLASRDLLIYGGDRRAGRVVAFGQCHSGSVEAGRVSGTHTMGGKVLVGNFGGAGRIAAFDDATGKFVDCLRDVKGAPIGIDGLWNILFGNGESLGDADTLYFTAGPADTREALFSAVRVAR